MADRDPAGPPPKEAVDYLRRKGVRPAFDYREVWREEHAHAFTVANMMKLDLLADVRASIAKAQEEGTPAARWKEELAAELSKRGWWGRHPPPDPNDKQAVEKANLYISRRLDTIWRVNTRQAAQAGVWERGQRSTSHPYILYRVGPSKRHRDQHLAWDGLLLPKDAEFWTVANPMNGWGCKCYTRFVTKAQYQRYVDQGVPGPVVGDGLPARKRVQTEEPALRPMQYRNDKTGEVHTGFTGIDHGFERNPGGGRAEQLGQVFERKLGALATDTVPVGAEVSSGLDVQITGKLGASVVHAIDTIELVHGDGNLPKPRPVQQDEKLIPRAATRHVRTSDGRRRVVRILMRERDNPWPEMLVVHEIGHYLDIAGLPGNDHQSTLATMPEMKALLQVIYGTVTWRAILRGRRDAKGPKDIREWNRLSWPLEAFARAYVQYIAWKSGDATLRRSLDERMAADQPPRIRLSQWPMEEFLPIAAAMDKLFEKAGWLTIR